MPITLNHTVIRQGDWTNDVTSKVIKLILKTESVKPNQRQTVICCICPLDLSVYENVRSHEDVVG